jgi:hypothetical protein
MGESTVAQYNFKAVMKDGHMHIAESGGQLPDGTEVAITGDLGPEGASILAAHSRTADNTVFVQTSGYANLVPWSESTSAEQLPERT